MSFRLFWETVDDSFRLQGVLCHHEVRTPLPANGQRERNKRRRTFVRWPGNNRKVVIKRIDLVAKKALSLGERARIRRQKVFV